MLVKWTLGLSAKPRLIKVGVEIRIHQKMQSQIMVISPVCFLIWELEFKAKQMKQNNIGRQSCQSQERINENHDRFHLI